MADFSIDPEFQDQLDWIRAFVKENVETLDLAFGGVEGTYDNIQFFGSTGQSVSTIDLRIFSGRWRHGFAVTEEGRRGTSRSLQFFDAAGAAVHKLYLRPESAATVYDALVAAHRAPDQGPGQAIEPAEPVTADRPDAEIDAEGLRAAWRALTDTHQFFGMLHRFGAGRTQALRLAGEALAAPLAEGALEKVLEKAQASELPFMVFVGNPGMIQIHTGPVKKVAPMGPWINVLDPGFNLHVRTDRIAQAWRVRKPTADGTVTSVELYDHAGTQIALLVGKRKPGMAEQAEWRALAESLPLAGV